MHQCLRLQMSYLYSDIIWNTFIEHIFLCTDVTVSAPDAYSGESGVAVKKPGMQTMLAFVAHFSLFAPSQFSTSLQFLDCCFIHTDGCEEAPAFNFNTEPIHGLKLRSGRCLLIIFGLLVQLN